MRLFVVPEVLEVHVTPSEEVRMVPEAPTATKRLFPKVALFNSSVVPEVCVFHVVAVEEVRIAPELPKVTYKQVEQNSVELRLKA